MSEMITLARVRAEAAKAVAEMGRDFVYNMNGGSCFYRIAQVGEITNGYSKSFVHAGDPKTVTPCIIGRILDSLHINNDHIRWCSTSVYGLFGDGGSYEGVFDSTAVAYMSILQLKQDRFSVSTWGACYDEAESHVRIHNNDNNH